MFKAQVNVILGKGTVATYLMVLVVNTLLVIINWINPVLVDVVVAHVILPVNQDVVLVLLEHMQLLTQQILTKVVHVNIPTLVVLHQPQIVGALVDVHLKLLQIVTLGLMKQLQIFTLLKVLVVTETMEVPHQIVVLHKAVIIEPVIVLNVLYQLVVLSMKILIRVMVPRYYHVGMAILLLQIEIQSVI